MPYHIHTCVVSDAKTYYYIQFLQFHTVSDVLLCLIVCIQYTVIMVMPYHIHMITINYYNFTQ